MKKILCFVLTVLCFSLTVVAEGSTVEAVKISVNTVAADGKVAVEISYKSDGQMSAGNMDIVYNSNLLKLESYETGEDITCSNIIVQKVTSSVLDNKGRLKIDMCAGGDAVLFTNGVAVEGTWSRADLDSRTVFVDKEGNEFKLTPGATWVEVMDQSCDLSYK